MEGLFTINGKKKKFEFAFDATLLQVLRANGYTEVKNGCEEGMCGTCSVLMNGVLMNACMIYAAQAVNKEITTVKGIGTILNPHPIQKAFEASGAVQCGFCTPGMVLATYALLKENSNPTEEEIKKALDGNLCRCTGYVKIIDAVKTAVNYLKETEKEN